MPAGMSRQTEQLIGVGFLLSMTVLLILAIVQFEGPTTFILLVVSGVFLLVALFFLTGTSMPRSSGGDTGGSQQQSVVIGGGGADPVKVITQGSVLVVCPHCKGRVPESSVHCPQCGEEL